MIIYSNYLMEVHQVLHCVRSSHWTFSVRKVVLINCAKFTGKHLCQSLFLSKKSFWHWCFPENLAKFLRIPFLQNTSGRLLLYRDFIFQTFSIIDFISPTIKDHCIKCICSKCFREGITESWIYYRFAARTVMKNLLPGLQ